MSAGENSRWVAATRSTRPSGRSRATAAQSPSVGTAGRTSSRSTSFASRVDDSTVVISATRASRELARRACFVRSCRPRSIRSRPVASCSTVTAPVTAPAPQPSVPGSSA
ncbi:hypothetical protein [Actinomadura geliboluensis]|uniref:hypothetical protein n=1 Tax=Actinomadura geliboluensis TaxID=882440 RepID=UPI00110B9731|nr:hypothetical protein [Actinomadura geliboluensis]